VLTQFFDPKLGLQTTGMYNANTLNSDTYIKKRVLVTLVSASAYTSSIYNNPLSQGTSYTYYNTENDDTVAFNLTIAAENNMNFLFSLDLAQNDVYFKQSFTTISIYTLLASFGGFYALINVSCNSLLNER
jgi:hypothetical protein